MGRSASQTVRRLFLDAGIDAQWRDFRIVGRRIQRKADPCGEPLKTNELIVRVVAGRAIASNDATMALDSIKAKSVLVGLRDDGTPAESILRTGGLSREDALRLAGVA